MGRSGAAFRGDFHAIQTGVIDSGYRGEISALIRFERDQVLEKNAKVAQLLIVPVAMLDPIEVDSLSESERGDKGFGSTGR
jgi:dUTP pyrophosphatase